MAYPNPELIDALRTTADKIESGEWDNNWGTPGQCNCGLLARSVLGEPLNFDVAMGSWNYTLQDVRKGSNWTYETPVCQSTGLTLAEIADILNGIGLKDEDLAQLEYLENEAIIEAMDPLVLDYHKDEHVVEYLRTWADLLEEVQPLADEREADEADEPAAETAKRPEADPIPA